MAPKSIEKSCFRYKDIWSSKNGDIKPEDVSISSNKLFLFECLKCHHDYDQTPADKTKGFNCSLICCYSIINNTNP